ncbi:phenylalanine--tRNA ligase subunit beta [uncultured Fretibacterium sp.]|uniref:phenylalanine--tRNA ligase subunit beta n=1 Tax=uncultured Fretibacterium sp. TaxID=1678694 RepID=UPI002601D80B|nr:phenylalanine--tRNA ligase subunit beta [uncultured Fretibacterium sp.]
MLVSWNLLKDFITLSAGPEEAAERLTMAGAEVEGLEYKARNLRGVVASRILSLTPHPAKEKLLVARLSTGRGESVCVTNAENVRAGDRVFYAPPGSTLPDGTELGIRDFYGLESAGMMLSAAELGVPEADDSDGILILPEDAPVGTEARALYGLSDTILDVSVTPNRGDLLSIWGIARELRGLFPDAKLNAPRCLEGQASGNDRDWPDAQRFGAISLPDPGCFCYHLGLAAGVAMGPSPLAVRVALVHMGMRPISNIVDATNYVMLVLGQPLHAFDLNTLPAREITVRAAGDGERMTTLDGRERVLTERDMLITSGGEPIAIAGVMGGDRTEIRGDTRAVVLESASFSPLRVGHTARRLGIASEAAFRFARTVDPTLSARALSLALELMRDWSGAEIGYRVRSASNDFPKPKPVTLTKKKLQTYLDWGDMDASTSILEGFGIRGGDGTDEARTFVPPTWRPDITIEEDLIEEVGRFRGYNDAPGRLPGEPPRGGDRGEPMRLSALVRSCLVARGYVEAVTYSFLPEDFPQKLLLPEDDLRAYPLTLANPISQDQIAMRTTLVPGLLGGLRTSAASGWRGAVRLFEQGRVFLRTAPGASTHVEHDAVAGLVFDGTDPRTPWKGQGEDFYSVKADVAALLEGCGLTPRFAAERQPFGHGGQTAEIRAAAPDGNVRSLGWLARLKPVLEQELGLGGGAVVLFELRLSGIEELRGNCRPVLRPASAFPASLRDISMLAPADRTQDEAASDIRAAAHAAAGWDILDELRLFDVYEGKGIPEGFRSLAFSLSYRAPDRTLNDEEVERVHGMVRDTLVQKGYNMR